MGMRPEALRPSMETYEHLGEVQAFSLDLHPRYRDIKEARQVTISPEAAHAVLTLDISAPPPVVWEWLNDPQRILRWSPDRQMVPGARPSGRTGVGARNHCVHGKKRSDAGDGAGLAAVR